MKLPTKEEINPHDDLDGRAACEHFYGKTIEEAAALLGENPIYYQEDLMCMGPVAFRFYLPAVVRFVQSEAPDPDFLIGLSGTLRFRFEEEQSELAPVADQLVELCDYILANWPQFEEATEYFGDSHDRFVGLREDFSTLKREA